MTDAEPNSSRDRPRLRQIASALHLLKYASVHALALCALLHGSAYGGDAAQAGAVAAPAVICAAAFGAMTSLLLSQWSLVVAAAVTGSSYRITRGLQLRVLDLEYARNTMTQFNAAALSASMGSQAAILLLASFAPMNTLGRTMLAGSVGAALYQACREWPAIVRAQGSRDPRFEMTRRGMWSRLGSVTASVSAGALLWLWIC